MGECCPPPTDSPQSSPKRRRPNGALCVARKQGLLLAIYAGKLSLNLYILTLKKTLPNLCNLFSFFFEYFQCLNAYVPSKSLNKFDILFHVWLTLNLCNFLISRCGNNFCASHRYAESHDCTFDYKTEGRKLLEQSNPVVSAPKLPKI